MTSVDRMWIFLCALMTGCYASNSETTAFIGVILAIFILINGLILGYFETKQGRIRSSRD